MEQSVHAWIQSAADAYVTFMDGRSLLDYVIAAAIVAAVNVVLVVSFGLLKLKEHKQYSHNAGTVTAALLMAALFEYVLRNLDNAVDWLVGGNVLYLGDAYGMLDGVLAPYTSYVLFFIPIYFVTFTSIRDINMPGAVAALLGLWFGVTMLFFLRYLVVVAVANPLSVVFFAAVGFALQLFSASAKRETLMPLLFSGMQFRSRTVKKTDGSSVVRQLTLLAVASGFYLHTTVSPEVQVAYYSALLSGLLAIIGFLALIFTFTFEMMGSTALRRSIAADTKGAQAAIGVLIGVTMVGFLVADAPVTFNLETVSLSSIVGVTVFTLSVLCGGAAMHHTIEFFHRMVDFVTETNFSDTSPVYAFAEMKTPANFSSVSTASEGLSDMRSHLEEMGVKVLAIEKANAVGLRRLRKAVVVLPRVASALSKDDAVFYRDFVRRGNGLMVLVDQADCAHKTELLSVFGITMGELPSAWNGGKQVFLDIKNELEIEEIGSLRAHMENVVSLKFTPEAKLEIEAEGLGPLLEPEHAIFVMRGLGKGLVLVVGSINHWNNQGIGRGDNSLFLDYVQTAFKGTFDAHAAQAAVSMSVERA